MMCTHFMTGKSWGHLVTEFTRWVKYQNYRQVQIMNLQKCRQQSKLSTIYIYEKAKWISDSMLRALKNEKTFCKSKEFFVPIEVKTDQWNMKLALKCSISKKSTIFVQIQRNFGNFTHHWDGQKGKIKQKLQIFLLIANLWASSIFWWSVSMNQGTLVRQSNAKKLLPLKPI